MGWRLLQDYGGESRTQVVAIFPQAQTVCRT
jgi:hypothetical protein